MGRKRKEFKRPEDKFDCRLIVIASEGSSTERNYFHVLAENYDNKRVHVEIVKSEDTKSDPESVLARLDDFYKSYDLGEDDNLYLVIDRDRWEEKNLSHVARQSSQKNFTLTLSNPNFELWVLLHKKDVADFSDDEKRKLFENEKPSKHKRYIDSILSEIWGGYNKTKFDFYKIIPDTLNAIKNAEKLDKNRQERWPNELATRVYIPVKDIIKDA